MATVVQAMQRPDSGLEIRDRMWLKITIPNAFIGTDMIDWLLSHVDGFQVSVFLLLQLTKNNQRFLFLFQTETIFSKIPFVEITAIVSILVLPIGSLRLGCLKKPLKPLNGRHFGKICHPLVAIT